MAGGSRRRRARRNRARAIREGRVSPVDAVERALDAIAAYDAELNAFTVTFAGEARRTAREAERRRGEPHRAPLLGVPVTVKDHIWMRDAPATNGSLALPDFRPSEDSVVVARLRDAGAIIVDKTNNPELLSRSSTDNALSGPTRNPWDPSRTPGALRAGAAWERLRPWAGRGPPLSPPWPPPSRAGAARSGGSSR